MNRRESLKLLLGAPLVFSGRAIAAQTRAASGNAAKAGDKFSIASKGKPNCVIVRQAGATPPEIHAVNELASMLAKITGTNFEVRESLPKSSQRAIVVGQGAIAASLFPEIPFASLGDEELVMRAKGKHLLLAGGRPRGTIYAVSRFLQDECNVRWWAPWAADIPYHPILAVGGLNVREKPAFEYRQAYWYPSLDGPWAARHFSNGQHSHLTEELGGKVDYVRGASGGFVHTFYNLVPPEEHFKEHPEWYSFRDGKRTITDQGTHAQLCLTNPQLKDFIVEQAKKWLREAPGAGIISISQNDSMGNNSCLCENCRALDESEGSQAGSLLAFVNYVAERIEPEFPHVAVDTLAYQYTQAPPKTIKPRPNVIVRLCSSGNYSEPFTNPVNAAFADTVRNWAKICNRLYIWDYTTNYAGYVMPHPNWFVLGSNVHFFQENNVKGVFEQGAYQSHGSEMAELRSWLYSRLLWNPHQNDEALIDEFLDGYYGPVAGRHIRRYLDSVREAARGFYLTAAMGPERLTFLDFKILSKAEKIWQQAEASVRNDSDRLWRVRQGHLPVRYMWLSHWPHLRRIAAESGAEWPLPTSRDAAADEWLSVATGPGPKGWSKMTAVNEGLFSPENFIAEIKKSPE